MKWIKHEDTFMVLKGTFKFKEIKIKKRYFVAFYYPGESETFLSIEVNKKNSELRDEQALDIVSSVKRFLNHPTQMLLDIDDISPKYIE